MLSYFIGISRSLFSFLFERKSGAMDVTKQNFEEIAPKVKKSIDEATFISIDCELTGLNTIRNINAFDTIKQYYKKVKVNCTDFLVIQYGISAFRYDKENDVFKQSSYNFYIFRRPLNKYIPDQRFLCQASSIDFLISQGFDFNKLFKEGIPYLNLDEEAIYMEGLEEKHKEKSDDAGEKNKQDKIAVPPSDQPFIDDVIQSIRAYLEGTDSETLQLPKCNPFCRKLIYQETARIFGDKIIVETKQLENKDRVLCVTKIKSPEELKSLAKEKYDADLKLLNEFVGFTRILRMVVESGKLIVGHNFLLDLIHTVDKFITPLTDDYQEFKECIHNLFPNTLDTKYMCSNAPFKDLVNSSALGPLLDTVKKGPFEIPKIETEDGCCGYSLDDNKEHEAAFDAFITGVSFLAMWNHLGKEAKLSSRETFTSSHLLEPYYNKIFLMKLQDGPYIHLGGNDPQPCRKHVFHVTFPSEWKTSDIQQLFSPFGNIYVAWINESSAFVGLYKREQANCAYKSLKGGSSSYVVKSYREFQEALAESSTGVTPPVKKMSTSSSWGQSPSDGVKKRKVSEGTNIPVDEEVMSKKRKSPRVSKVFAENNDW